uniref:Exonuclease domain-containing protein n=1 Tax=Arcella intermedia TaxID=1963864 RepID=A0A6B2LHU9_9EUKA
MVLDVESTCDKDNPTWPNEVIEFPVILLDPKKQTLETFFHKHVRPTENPTLTHFCKDFTGITQEQVDTSDTIDVVLSQFHDHLIAKNFNVGNCREGDEKDTFSFAVLTDGPWDLRDHLGLECRRKQIKTASYLHRWVNIRWLFSEFFGCPRRNVSGMLSYLKLSFEGREHSGIDDAYNIARIALSMVQSGCKLRVNDGLVKPPRPIKNKNKNKKQVKK